MDRFFKIFCLVTLMFVSCVLSDFTFHPDDQKKMSFKTPKLSEEEMSSW